uniref:Uncharacterized protein n=1 Tax=Mola mola TaxID=94237 RepID=A0A3Q3WDF6_MOLML
MFSSGITDGNIKIGGQAGGGLMVMVESPQQEQFFKMMSYLERGRMEEQRCALSTGPQVLNGLVHFFNLLANSQGQRLDDQQVSLPSLPGIQKANTSSSAGGDSGYLCYMVSKVQVSTSPFKIFIVYFQQHQSTVERLVLSEL